MFGVLKTVILVDRCWPAGKFVVILKQKKNLASTIACFALNDKATSEGITRWGPDSGGVLQKYKKSDAGSRNHIWRLPTGSETC